MLNSILGVIGSPTAPLGLPVAGAALWLDADDASTFTYSSGSSVSQWNDKSGNARNFTQATTSAQPIRQSSMQGGKSGLNLNTGGTTRWIANSSYDFSNAAFTVFAVLDFNGSNFPAAVGRNLGSVAGGPALALGADSGSSFYAISRIQQATSSSNLAPTGSNGDVVAYKSSGISGGSVSVMIYRNGTAASGAVSLGSLAAGNKTIIGASRDGVSDTFGADGYVCEVIIYPSQLSDTDRNLVEGYLKTKWGTP
jgi:hypothetical protein